MPLTIQIWDEIVPGQHSSPELITVADATTTVRELIRSRVRQEVDRFNQQAHPEVFRGLVQPEQSEQILNGFRMSVPPPLDWNIQFQRACSSFERNGFLIVIDGCQLTDLDERIELSPDSEVQFVKLVPLVGG